MLARQAARWPPHGVAFLLRGSAPNAGLPGGQGVGQARGPHGAPKAHGLGGKNLCQRLAGRGDRKEKLGIFTPAGASRHPACGAADEL